MLTPFAISIPHDMQCHDRGCQASFYRCSKCSQIEAMFTPLGRTGPTAADDRSNSLLQAVFALVSELNNIPASSLPPWVLDCTVAAAQAAQHVATHLWDDCGNLPGSALMLLCLRPHIFGVPNFPPLRIFGCPAPTAMLLLDPPAPPRRPRDNHRTNCVAGLLGHFHAQGDMVRGHMLQDCWWQVQGAIIAED